MGLLTAFWWIFKIMFSVISAAVLIVAFGVLLATIPALVFFLRAVVSDWELVKPLLRSSHADVELQDIEDSKNGDDESLIPEGADRSDSAADQKSSIAVSDGSKRKPSAEGKGTAVEKGHVAGQGDLDGGESAPLKTSPLEEAELEEFLDPSIDVETPRAPAVSPKASAYGRRVVVIIPALNEEKHLPQTLGNLNSLQPPVALVVVADGGSSDRTKEIAKAKGAVVIECEEKGRAKQMNAGAKEAARVMREQDEKEGEEGLLGAVAGDTLFCFLHADTQVPKDLVAILQSKFAEPSTCAVGFVPLIAVPGRIFTFLSLCDTAKTWFCAAIQKPRAFMAGLRTLYGDQAISCCARDFFRVGGFDESMPILEDADLCEKLHQEGSDQPGRNQKVSLVPRIVVTSGRRFVKMGMWRGCGINLWFALAYLRRASTEELHELYVKLYKDIR